MRLFLFNFLSDFKLRFERNDRFYNAFILFLVANKRLKPTAIDKLIQEYQSYRRFKIHRGAAKSVKRTTIIDEKDAAVANQNLLNRAKTLNVSPYVKSHVQAKQNSLDLNQKTRQEISEKRHKSAVDSITFVAPDSKKNLKLIMANPHPDDNLLLKLLPLNAKNFPGRVLVEDSAKEDSATNKTEPVFASQAKLKTDDLKKPFRLKTKVKSFDENRKMMGRSKKFHNSHNLTFFHRKDLKKSSQTFLKLNYEHNDEDKDLTASKPLQNYLRIKHEKSGGENRTVVKLSQNNIRLDDKNLDGDERSTENKSVEGINSKLLSSKQTAKTSHLDSIETKGSIATNSIKSNGSFFSEDKRRNSANFIKSTPANRSVEHLNINANFSPAKKHVGSDSTEKFLPLKATNKQYKTRNLDKNSLRELDNFTKPIYKKQRLARKTLYQNIHIKSIERSPKNRHKKHQQRSKRPVILVAKIADDLDRNTFVEDIFRALGISDILKIDVTNEQGEELQNGDEELSGESQTIVTNSSENDPEINNFNKLISRENASVKNEITYSSKTPLKNEKFAHRLTSTHNAVGHIVND